MRPGTFAAIYAFEPVLFPVEVNNRQVLHATVGLPKFAMMLLSHAGHATRLIMLHLLPPVEQGKARQGFCPLQDSLAFTATTFETKVEVSLMCTCS